MTAAITGILLAAGQSTRFGANKLLHRLGDGTPMAVAAARPLTAVLACSIAVVADAQNGLAGQLAQEGLRIIPNPRAGDGMGTSIACGVAASPDASGWVIALADMPCIPEAVIQAIVDGLDRGADIIAPVYQGQRGHPVGFSARHADALMQLQGDAGARGIIAAHRDSLELIETPEAGVILDIDRNLTGQQT
ncbi:MAG: nucleotidyltransferase family protein [Gammaproteobacteria bacterium]|jgi:molybdenum cofactor cytidylyltransferase|nr:nucleotidyltransferase family protein [Gammaproteobacteria bacterium]